MRGRGGREGKMDGIQRRWGVKVRKRLNGLGMGRWEAREGQMAGR